MNPSDSRLREHSLDGQSPPVAAARGKLLTFSSGGWVILISFFFTLVAAALVLYPVFAHGFHPAVGDGRHVESYGFDLSNLAIPREQLVASVNPKDAMQAIPVSLVETLTPAEVKLINENEYTRFLVSSDRVIGITLGGESRAYPVRVMNLHELVNDVVGGVPVAVTWSGPCASAVVFDRRIDEAATAQGAIDGDARAGIGAPGTGAAVEFGVSGLLVDSDSVFFDRGQAGKESLWPQLALRAVSGPAAGTRMKLVPYEMTTWGQWCTEHPDTRVLQGFRTRKAEYRSEPYSTYLNNDDVIFPVQPLWTDAAIPRKTRIKVISEDGSAWQALREGDAFPGSATSTAASIPPPAPSPPRFVIYTFLFAWYAQHPTDTDYSALRR